MVALQVRKQGGAKDCAEEAEVEDQRGEEKIQEEDGGPAAAEQHQWCLERPGDHLRIQNPILPG